MKIILETNRLRLREFTAKDSSLILTMMSDPVVMKYYPGIKLEDECQFWISKAIEGYETDGYAPWAIELKSNKKFVGYCGLIRQNIDDVSETEIGYMLARENWGEGIATEAAIACKEYGFGSLYKKTLISLIRPENKPSLKVAQRVGMTQWKETDFQGYLHTVYRITNPSFFSFGSKHLNH